ncbi:hypothetical protein BDV96DRAFT_645744 [Lophiotrema nucula]|uniref:Uncharacterized protein n=1 Tax=Lophiotrema nucula TaxID=690887 RepID=A0A6A5ZBK5_9PLEO|nr:hypothetical protein BDV96DRAFT_645744 [Lophiotrema nucula]
MPSEPFSEPFQPPQNTTRISRPGPSGVTYHIPHTPPPSPTSQYKTTIILPKASTWSSNLHWHETHTEYLCLKRGAIYVQLDNAFYILSAKHGGIFYSSHSHSHSSHLDTKTHDPVPILSSKIQNGVVTVDKGVRHCWHRASLYYSQLNSSTPSNEREEVLLPSDIDDDVIVQEHTSPTDIQKPLFFFNLNSILNSPPSAPLPVLARGARRVLGEWWIDFQLFVVFRELDNWPVIWGGGGRMAEYLASHLVLFLAGVLGRLVGVRAVVEERTPRELWDAWRREKGLVEKKRD